MATFISLAISDTMFPAEASLSKSVASPDMVREAVENGAVSALNPSHASTIDVIRRKFNLELPIPERAPKVALQSGDALIVIQAQLPRLNEGETHKPETVENAVIKFSLWTVK